MADISSIPSSTVDFLAQQTAALKKAASSATTSFQSTLAQVQSTVVGKPATGFTSGATYEAGTLTGQTKAAYNSTVATAKSVLNIKP